MTKSPPTRRSARSSEEGYVLLAVIFMLAVFIIAMSVAAPKVAQEIRRDRELETMQRGKQYIRGIKMYYKKFNAYPPNLEALVKTNNIRFLRKKYVDPTTGNKDWKPVRYGQNKAPTAMGFFGQPLTESTLAGTGASGGNTLSGTSTSSSTSTSTSGTTSSTSSSSSSSGLTGQTFGGAGIIGYSPNSPKQSILFYKKKNHYNEWEFVYDPISERTTLSNNTGSVGQSASSAFSSTSSSSTSTSTSDSSSSTTTSTTTP